MQSYIFVPQPNMYSWPFMAFPGKSWILVIAFHEDPVRTSQDTVDTVGLARNVVRKFVVDHRSTTVDGCATVLSSPHYGV